MRLMRLSFMRLSFRASRVASNKLSSQAKQSSEKWVMPHQVWFHKPCNRCGSSLTPRTLALITRVAVRDAEWHCVMQTPQRHNGLCLRFLHLPAERAPLV